MAFKIKYAHYKNQHLLTGLQKLLSSPLRGAALYSITKACIPVRAFTDDIRKEYMDGVLKKFAVNGEAASKGEEAPDMPDTPEVKAALIEFDDRTVEIKADLIPFEHLSEVTLTPQELDALMPLIDPASTPPKQEVSNVKKLHR